ncbi:hypothetical protein LX36DRAFT_477828 [Colletotrichum falcatum]|nr:hypothetical protein LX36DRAFT_477828 [Colletotrichum falcatum]
MRLARETPISDRQIWLQAARVASYTEVGLRLRLAVSFCVWCVCVCVCVCACVSTYPARPGAFRSCCCHGLLRERCRSVGQSHMHKAPRTAQAPVHHSQPADYAA